MPVASAPTTGALAAPSRSLAKPTAAHPGRRLALTTLLDRIADTVDFAPLRASPVVSDPLAIQLERAAQEAAAAMRKDGEAPEGVDLDAIVREAVRELVGTGPIGALLDDDDVTEIHCTRFDQIVTRRAGAGVVTEPTTFSSEEALYRAMVRLAQQSGDPWRPGEPVMERRVPRGTMLAVTPPLSSHHVVSIRKFSHVNGSLDALTQAGVLSKPMAQFIEACMAARANILVFGTKPLPVLAALAAGATSSERVVSVQDVEEVGAGGAHVAKLSVLDAGKGGEESVRAAVKLHPDRLIVSPLVGGVAAGTLDAILGGNRGVLAALPGPSLRQAVGRLVAQLALYRPSSLTLDGMREVVAEAFDVAIEVVVLAEGRLRVTRIAELGPDAKGIAIRDIFTADAGAEGGATGAIPRIAADLANQGIKLDPALFKKAAR
jgi:pilus assembly protein CpaF